MNGLNRSGWETLTRDMVNGRLHNVASDLHEVGVRLLGLGENVGRPAIRRLLPTFAGEFDGEVAGEPVVEDRAVGRAVA